jgi:hypothetical protein
VRASGSRVYLAYCITVKYTVGTSNNVQYDGHEHSVGLISCESLISAQRASHKVTSGQDNTAAVKYRFDLI